MIRYTVTSDLPVEAVQRLLKQTEWAANRSDEYVAEMLLRSVCASAWSDDMMVGFARAVTDNIYRAFIEDVVVDDDIRGRGIGGGLIHALLNHLHHVEEVCLFCEDGLVTYWANFGFEPVSNNALHIRRIEEI